MKPIIERNHKDDGQPLGSIRKFASVAAVATRNWRADMVVNRYKLQDAARRLLPNYAVNACMRVPIKTGVVEIWVDTQTNHAHIKNVGRCGSIWACPVCATRIGMGRRQELEQGMSKARAMGWVPVFVTFTSRHNRNDTIRAMRERTRKAQRALKAGRWWQENVKALGLEGTITAIEATWGAENGWHVHYHAIMFFNQWVDLADLENKLFERWDAVLTRHDLSCTRDHGVRVLPGNAAASYISKWGLDQELTGMNKDAKDGHFTPFQLLAKFEAGNTLAGELFKDFANAFKGVSQIRWGRGLRASLEMTNELSDQELAEQETSEKSVRIGFLYWNQYREILSTGGAGAIGKMLMVAELGGLALYTWLLFEFNILIAEDG